MAIHTLSQHSPARAEAIDSTLSTFPFYPGVANHSQTQTQQLIRISCCAHILSHAPTYFKGFPKYFPGQTADDLASGNYGYGALKPRQPEFAFPAAIGCPDLTYYNCIKFDLDTGLLCCLEHEE